MYITLASNASMSTYGAANTASSFTNTLSKTLDFRHGVWEVGVKKLIYHNKFDTIVNEMFKVTSFNRKSTKHMLPSSGKYYKYDSGNISLSDKLAEEYKLKFSSKVYNRLMQRYVNATHDITMSLSIQNQFSLRLRPPTHPFTEADYVKEEYVEETSEIYSVKPDSYTNIEAILKQLNSKCKAAKFSYTHERVTVKFRKHSEITENPSNIVTLVDSDIEHVTLLGGLHYILGFEKPLLKEDETATYAPKLNRGLFAIFIYSNICSYSSVGDSTVPLLQVLSMPTSKEGEIVSIDVIDPMYIPVAYNTLSEIYIKLTGDTGEELPFYGDDTKTILTLHFRRKL